MVSRYYAASLLCLLTISPGCTLLQATYEQRVVQAMKQHVELEMRRMPWVVIQDGAYVILVWNGNRMRFVDEAHEEDCPCIPPVLSSSSQWYAHARPFDQLYDDILSNFTDSQTFVVVCATASDIADRPTVIDTITLAGHEHFPIEITAKPGPD